MSAFDYTTLAAHVGHKIACVAYADVANVAVECEDCGEVLLSYDRDEKMIEEANGQALPDPYEETPEAKTAFAKTRAEALPLERDLTTALTLAHARITELWSHNTSIEAGTLADAHDSVAAILRNLGAPGPWGDNDDDERAAEGQET